MKIKTSRQTINHFLEYRWAPVICSLLLSYVLVYFTIHKINAFKNYEKIVIFSSGGYLNDQSLKEDILKDIPEILNVDIYAYSANENMLTQLYQAYGRDADFLILNDEDLKAMEEIIPEYWLPYDQNSLTSSAIEDFEYYQLNEVNYGLKVFDYTNKSYNEKYHFNDFISFDGNYNYYLLCSAHSVNFSRIKETNTSDNGYKLLNYLLSRYCNG